MKQNLTLFVLVLTVSLIFTGCSCSHEWAEADCVTPKTCSKCQETEGEALGHRWREATCTAPRTCASCGLTEGGPLDHTWVEANYQTSRTCTVCNATEGEPRAAAFEELGLEFNVDQVNVEYPLHIGGKEYTYTIDRYEVYPSDDSHSAREGFEWRTVTHTVKGEGKIPNVLPIYGDYNNCYDMESFNETAVQIDIDQIYAMRFTVNYHGEDYPTCLFQVEESRVDGENSTWWLTETMSFQVPVGFDGMFLCMGDAGLIADDYYARYMDLYTDENTLFFRLQ